MRVAVTGARGFIGSSLVPVLEARGHEVVSIPREALFSAASFSRCEAVVHLANIAHRAAGASLLEEVNTNGTRRVAELAAGAGTGRFVYLSSIKVSGEESFARPFDGSEEPAPQDAYGRAKLAAERALGEVAAKTGLHTTVLRPPLVYGPRVKGKFLALMRAIARGWPLPLGAIRNRRSLVHVENVADLVARCVEARAPLPDALVLADGMPVSTPALCRALGDALGRPARLFNVPAALLDVLPAMRPLTRSLEVDDAVARKALEWRPIVSFEQGIRLTAQWYRLECAA